MTSSSNMQDQDAESYQELLDKVDAAEELDAIRQGLEQSLAGRGRPAADSFAEFEREHNLKDRLDA